MGMNPKKLIKLLIVVIAFGTAQAILEAVLGIKEPQGWKGWVYDMPIFICGAVVGKILE